MWKGFSERQEKEGTVDLNNPGKEGHGRTQEGDRIHSVFPGTPPHPGQGRADKGKETTGLVRGSPEISGP